MRKPLTKEHREQLKRVAAMPDAEIDFSDAPDTAGGIYKVIKLPVALRLDADILAWWRSKPRYPTRINKILRQATQAER